jgi:hypothetical protein
VPNRDNWDGSFHSQTFSASEVRCHVLPDTNVEDNHTIIWTGMFTHDSHLQAFLRGTVPISINCTSMFQDISQQHIKQIPQSQQKTPLVSL